MGCDGGVLCDSGAVCAQVMDELVPKATGGREARLEKKKARTERRREKETSPGVPPHFN